VMNEQKIRRVITRFVELYKEDPDRWDNERYSHYDFSGCFLIILNLPRNNFKWEYPVGVPSYGTGKKPAAVDIVFATDNEKWIAVEWGAPHIYGVDLDPKAIDITAFTLMVQVYDELKEGARCPTMIGENLKVGNSLVSAITPEEKEGFISRKELEEKFKDGIAEIIRLRKIEKGIDNLDDSDLRRLIKENFDDVVETYRLIKEKYPNAIPTAQQKLLDEWHKRAKNEPLGKTFDVLITQTRLARIFLKEVFFEKIRKVKERIEFEINRPLIRYFNSEKRVLSDKELKEILGDETRIEEELKFVKDRATEISKSQPPKAFNWKIEFPEVFFSKDGTLKENPGFDCVVRNPPYGGNIESALKDFWEKSFSNILEKEIDTYALFIRFSFDILKQKGFVSQIVPNTFLNNYYNKQLRSFILNNSLIKIIGYAGKVFEDAIRENAVFVFSKQASGTIDGITNNVIRFFAKQHERIAHEDYTEIVEQNVLKNWLWCIFDTKLTKVQREIINKIDCIKEAKPGQVCDIQRGIERGKDYKGFKRKPTKGHLPVIWGECIDRYFFSHTGLYTCEYYPIHLRPIKLVFQRATDRLQGAIDTGKLVNIKTVWNIAFKSVHKNLECIDNYKILLAQYNSALINFYYQGKFAISKSLYPEIQKVQLEEFPVYLNVNNRQLRLALIILVDAIIQKKKEYHAISQNIEDYIDFGKANLIRLDEFFKGALDDFDFVSSLKAKHDNFDTLRLRIEGDRAIVEYGIRRKVEDYEEIEEDEQVEVRGKYVVEWHPAGEGKIKDGLAVEFLAKIIE